jgi:hypothetical protein
VRNIGLLLWYISSLCALIVFSQSGKYIYVVGILVCDTIL